jgi:putative MATE family efflux protein
VLAPFLIFGWGTGRAFGVAGAAISSLIAIIVGLVWIAAYFYGPKAYLHLAPRTWKPRLDTWKRMLAIGLPTGFEFTMMAVYMMIVYSVSRPFGAAAQAGFGIGQRIIQAGFMPVVALGFAVAPVAGQNFGARLPHRVRATFKDGALMASGAMLFFTIICHIIPGPLVGVFSKDLSVTAVGAEYLEIISWNFLASGLIFVASSMFQAMGNTMPSLIASAARITLVGVPVLYMSRLPWFELHHIWYTAVAAVLAHLTISMLFLRREFRRRLQPMETAGSGGVAPEGAVVS